MRHSKKTTSGCLVIFFFIFCIWALFSYFREDYEKYFMRDSEKNAIPWYEAVETCKEMYRSVAQYGAVVPNCRKRKENATEFTFMWNSSVPIILRNKYDEETRNSGVCTVSKETGEIISISLNNKNLLETGK